jgi:ribosomal protein S18 acetylase RimI-like enzyme
LVPEDAPALVALRREALEAHPLAFGASPDEDRGLSLEFVRDALDPGARERTAVFGLFEGGTLAGLVGVVRAAERKRRHRSHIWGLYVAPPARRNGAGRALLEAAIAHARSWPGVTLVELSVSSASPEALRLYRLLGFRQWGSEPQALSVDGTFVDEYHLAIHLDPERAPDLPRADSDEIAARVARTLQAGDVLDGLARRLPPSDLQSLLLHVFRRRSAGRGPADLLAQYERTPRLRPSAVDARTLLGLERAAFACADAFEAVALAPIAPVGVNVVLGGVDQNNALATVRSDEVLADPTTLQALECARRRRSGDASTIRLASRSHPVRLQPTDVPWFSPHFALFSLVSAGRDRGSWAFEMESLREHLRAYLTLVRRLATEGYSFATIDLALSDTGRNRARLDAAGAGVLEPLATEFPKARLRVDDTREQGRNYYAGLCFSLNAVDPKGMTLNLADGGFTDWTRRLLSNAKERLLVSGIGLELVAKRFRTSP